MNVDAYVATVNGTPAYDVVNGLLDVFGGEVQAVDNPRKSRQYQAAAAFQNVTTGRTEGIVRFGGNGGGVNVDFTGQCSELVASHLRTTYPHTHSPSRVDLAVDLTGPGLFDATYDALVPLAKAQHPRVEIEPRGDWVYREKGRSAYFGSRQSVCQTVLYQKGLQQIHEEGSDADPDWVRLELRVRPDRSLRPQMAGLDLHSLFGLRAFPRACYEAFTGLSCTPVEYPKLLTSEESAFAAFCDQYGAKYLRWIEKHGAPKFQRLVAAHMAEPSRWQLAKAAADHHRAIRDCAA